MNMFVCLSTSQTNEHWPLIGRTNEHDLTNTVRLFIGHPGSEPVMLLDWTLIGLMDLDGFWMDWIGTVALLDGLDWCSYIQLDPITQKGNQVHG